VPEKQASPQISMAICIHLSKYHIYDFITKFCRQQQKSYINNKNINVRNIGKAEA
jgi:hypothetical protein